MVPRAGIEPALPHENEILNLACLPIPPPGRAFNLTAKILSKINDIANTKKGATVSV